jgi:hypothetical protein
MSARGTLSLLGAWLAIGPAPSVAQNRGVYPLGMSATNSGVTPASGFSYGNQLIFYARNQAKDDHGDTLPVTGLNTVVMDLNSFIWVSTTRVFGARYSATATIPVARNSLTSDLRGDISGGSGLADSYFLPVILGWDADRVLVRALYGFLAPTGRFEAGADDNVGSGYWTHTLSSGQTFHLTTSESVTLSAFEMYEVHTTQEDSGTRPGDTFNLDGSLMGALLRGEDFRLQLGVVGYLQRQTTATTGPGVDAAASDERYAVNALGFAASTALPKHQVSVTVKYFDEFANRATFQGYAFQIAGTISF